MQGSEVDVEDVKRVYSLFLDEHRSTVFLQVSHIAPSPQGPLTQGPLSSHIAPRIDVCQFS